MQLTHLFQQAKQASRSVASMTDEARNAVLLAVAEEIRTQSASLLQANRKDLAAMHKSNPLYDRLMLTDERLCAISHDMENVTRLPSPLGRVSHERTLDNGLRLIG